MRFDTKLYSDEPCELVMSRRNLTTLLAKLNGHPPNSACAIETEGIIVKAEEDDVHYRDRRPSRMVQETEEAIGTVRVPPDHIVR